MSTRTIHWTEDTKTMKIRTDVPGFFIEFGQQMVIRVKNDTQNQIDLGTVVYLSGSDDFPTLEIADYTSYLTSDGTLGFVAHNVSGDTQGYVVTQGILRNVDLTNFSDGDEIYLYTGGTFSNIKPIAPLPEVYLGTVVKSGENGILNVNIELGFELEELHNIKITDPNDGDVLIYDHSQSIWVNKKTFTGNYNFSGSVSATTFYGDGSNLSGVGGKFNGGDVNGNTNFLSGVTANTFTTINSEWTVDLMDEKTIEIYITEQIKILSINNIINNPTVTILIDGSQYQFGDVVDVGSRINITSDINSIIVLNIQK